MNSITSKEVLQTFDYDGYTINVVYVRWSGGGEGYEFQVLDAGKQIYLSGDGYGQALPAAAGAYEWVQGDTRTKPVADDTEPIAVYQMGRDKRYRLRITLDETGKYKYQVQKVWQTIMWSAGHQTAADALRDRRDLLEDLSNNGKDK